MAVLKEKFKRTCTAAQGRSPRSLGGKEGNIGISIERHSNKNEGSPV